MLNASTNKFERALNSLNASLNISSSHSEDSRRSNDQIDKITFEKLSIARH